MVFHDVYNLIVVFCVYTDLVHNLKACLFTHSLDFAYQLTYEAFFDQFRSQIGIQNNSDCMVGFGNIAFHLCHVDQQILL